MKIKDYLHSDLLSDRNNDMVFQKTYDTIHKFAKKQTEMMAAAFNITDKQHLQDLDNMNASMYSDEIVELVNYAIHKFNKRHKRHGRD
jgi:hypothetical protein